VKMASAVTVVQLINQSNKPPVVIVLFSAVAQIECKNTKWQE